MPTKKKSAPRTTRRDVKKKTVGARGTRPPKRPAKRASPAAIHLRPPETTGGPGACIRCRVGLPFDGQYPMCRSCFDEWVRRADPDHIEKWCHSCREPEPVTYARPVCNRCGRMQSMTI